MKRYIKDYNIYSNNDYNFGKNIPITTWSYCPENTILKTLQQSYELAIIDIFDHIVTYHFNNDKIIVNIIKYDSNDINIEQINEFGSISTILEYKFNNIIKNKFYDIINNFFNIKKDT